MSSGYKDVDQDERTQEVTREGESLGFKIISILVLVDVAYRSFVKGEAAWDLLLIVIVGGLLPVLNQFKRRAFTQGMLRGAMIAAAVGAAVSVLLTVLRIGR